MGWLLSGWRGFENVDSVAFLDWGERKEIREEEEEGREEESQLEFAKPPLVRFSILRGIVDEPVSPAW